MWRTYMKIIYQTALKGAVRPKLSAASSLPATSPIDILITKPLFLWSLTIVGRKKFMKGGQKTSGNFRQLAFNSTKKFINYVVAIQTLCLLISDPLIITEAVNAIINACY